MKHLVITAAIAAVCGTAAAETASYAVDPTHAAAIFEIGHFATSTNRGRFPVKEGSVQLDRAAKSGKVDITINVQGINTGVPALDKHLQSKDFFSADEFPTAKFVGDKFTFNGDKVSEVAGQLTMLGKTHPVTLKATNFNCYTSPVIKREVCGGDFQTTVKRSLWGVSWGLDYGFSDDVHVLIQVEAVKQ